jgi:hypothetical protein
MGVGTKAYVIHEAIHSLQHSTVSESLQASGDGFGSVCH